MLEDEFRYYIKNQAQLSEQYEGKTLVLKDQKVIGAYDSKGRGPKEDSR